MILQLFSRLLLKTSFTPSFIFILGVCAVVVVGSGCNASKNVRYFENLNDSNRVRLPKMERTPAVIMPDDILEIKIGGANEATAALLNSYSGSSASATATGVPQGTSSNSYLVDSKGEVEFPIIGKIKAAGLSREQFRDKLKSAVSPYLKDPLVNVRFANFRFTVLGEVKMPGTYTVPNEKVTVLEALGHAGDMNSFGNRTNVKVIRDSSGNREIGVINFTDKAMFTSDYYYLQRNDVVYVEAQKSKSQYEEFTRISPIIATLASVIALAITILR